MSLGSPLDSLVQTCRPPVFVHYCGPCLVIELDTDVLGLLPDLFVDGEEEEEGGGSVGRHWVVSVRDGD